MEGGLGPITERGNQAERQWKVLETFVAVRAYHPGLGYPLLLT